MVLFMKWLLGLRHVGVRRWFGYTVWYWRITRTQKEIPDR